MSVGPRSNELSSHLEGDGSEGVSGRRGIINIIFHSNEANLYLSNICCQVIFALISNQDIAFDVAFVL